MRIHPFRTSMRAPSHVFGLTHAWLANCRRWRHGTFSGKCSSCGFGVLCWPRGLCLRRSRLWQKRCPESRLLSAPFLVNSSSLCRFLLRLSRSPRLFSGSSCFFLALFFSLTHTYTQLTRAARMHTHTHTRTHTPCFHLLSLSPSLSRQYESALQASKQTFRTSDKKSPCVQRSRFRR